MNKKKLLVGVLGISLIINIVALQFLLKPYEPKKSTLQDFEILYITYKGDRKYRYAEERLNRNLEYTYKLMVRKFIQTLNLNYKKGAGCDIVIPLKVFNNIYSGGEESYKFYIGKEWYLQRIKIYIKKYNKSRGCK